jgi:hypothetical protein
LVLRFLLVLVGTFVLARDTGYTVVLLTVDQLQTAVAQDLSSRYCPHSKTLFLVRSLALFGVFAAAVLALLFAANHAKHPSGRTQVHIVAGALLLFAIGSGALVLYGVSGCSGAAAEGLIWNWP